MLGAGWTSAVGRAGLWALRSPRFLPRSPLRSGATTSGQSRPAPLGFSRRAQVASAQVPGFIKCRVPGAHGSAERRAAEDPVLKGR